MKRFLILSLLLVFIIGVTFNDNFLKTANAVTENECTTLSNLSEIELSYTVLTCEFEFDVIVNMGQRLQFQNPEGGSSNMLPSASIGGTSPTGPGVYQYSSGDFSGTITLQNPPNIGITLENVQSSFSDSQLSVSGDIVNNNDFPVKDLYVYWHVTDGSGQYLSSWTRYGPSDGSAYSAQIEAQSSGSFSETMCCGNEGTVTPYIVQAFRDDGIPLIDVPVYVSDTTPITQLTINTLEIYETSEGNTRFHIIGDAPASTNLTFTIINPDGEVDGTSSSATGDPAYDHDGLIFEPFDGNWSIEVCATEYDMCAQDDFVIEQEPLSDVIPPVIVVPNDMAIEVTSNNPSPVTFSVSATDDTDGTVTPTCSPSSGNNFSIGTTIVTCTATDEAGNSSSESFTVTLSVVEPIPISMELDKTNYASTEDVHITVSGNPGDVVSLLIIDPSDTPVGDTISIQIGPDGRTQHTIDLDKFSSGVYTAVASKGTSRSSAIFTVGLQTGSGDININTTKTEYQTGDQILVLGETDSNVLVTLTLLDQDGNEIKKRESFSNKNGKITNNSFTIPSGAESGLWSIKATSGSNSDVAEFEVNTIDQDELVVFVEDSTHYAGVGDSITIKVIGATQTVEIDIISSKGEIIESLSFSASDEGELKVPWIIPADTETGTYTIKVQDPFDSAVTTFVIEGEEPSETKFNAEVSVVSGSSVPGCEETNECYIPYSAHVSVGGEVTWHNDDSAAHTVTSGTPDDGPNGIFDSSLFMAGSSFSYKFEEEGTYHYFCMVHPWMEGEVIVGEGGPAPIPVSINIRTDDSSYTLGDKIRVTGVVRPFDSQTVSLRIINPQGDLALIDQFIPSSSGTFTKEYTAAGDKWRTSGTFSLSASIGTDSDKITFRVTKPIPDELPEPGPFSDTANVSVSTGSSIPGCEENNSCYIPYEARINTFGQVIWHNDDSAAHTVTSGTPADGPDGKFDSSLFMAGAEFSHKFEESGIYDYFCMVHPWMEGIIVVGEETTRPPPEPEDHVDLDIWMEERVYDINTVAVLNIEISGNTRAQNIAIDVADPRDTTKISRSVELEPNESISFEFKIDESFKTGNYRVTATTSDDDRTEKDTAHFKVKSQFNSFKITSVEVTNQKGNPDDLVAGETGFIKVELESNKSIATLVTVNIFDSELTSIGIGSVQTTLSSGNSEIILSFMIPEDAALGSAEIFVNAFSDWPSNGGVPLTGEFAAVEDIQ